VAAVGRDESSVSENKMTHENDDGTRKNTVLKNRAPVLAEKIR